MFGIRKDYLYFSIVIIIAIVVSSVSWNISNSISYNTSLAIVSAESMGNVNSDSLPINIISPRILAKIKSPINIKGTASGKWFFEGSFPVKIIDNKEKILGQGPVTAKSDYITEGSVQFEGHIPFSTSDTKNGFVVFSPDDPSGQGLYDSIKIPVIFSEVKIDKTPCTVSGCSAELCGESSQISVCEYKNEYVCYETAKCERQESGKCAWTPTPELERCLKEKSI